MSVFASVCARVCACVFACVCVCVCVCVIPNKLSEDRLRVQPKAHVSDIRFTDTRRTRVRLLLVSHISRVQDAQNENSQSINEMNFILSNDILGNIVF